MRSREDSGEAQAAIAEATEELEMIVSALDAAVNNVEFAEDVLREARALNRPDEIASAKAEVDECRSDLEALKQDHSEAYQNLNNVKAHWGY